VPEENKLAYWPPIRPFNFSLFVQKSYGPFSAFEDKAIHGRDDKPYYPD
jgi:hypothetical protein